MSRSAHSRRRDHIETLVVTNPATDRYASSRLIPWWDQQYLAEARVMVVGAGALGNEVLKNLALLGVGHLYIVDFDSVELSNLTRSVLFRAGDVGKRKAEVAAERVRELNPDIQIYPIVANVAQQIGLGLFRRMDVVLGCLDNREARWAVNRACWRMRRPWIDGGLDTLNGAVKVFVPPDGACYECGLTEQDRQIMTLRYSCPGWRGVGVTPGRIPTTITAASIIAGIQVQEALKLLHKLPVSPGRAFLYNGNACRALQVDLARREECLAHEEWASIIEVAVSAANTTLAALLNVARELLGNTARIHLDRQILCGLTCSDCGFSAACMKPYNRLASDAPLCPRCGAILAPEITHILYGGLPNQETTLAEVGIPPLHILRASAEEKTVYLELTADAEHLLNGQEDYHAI